jgi:threonine dehydrogenase-like Zn-dependent dehydrogenase
MKAAVIRGRGAIEVIDRPVPEPQPGWVRLAMGAVGICGTDLHLFNGLLTDATGLQPGHEVAATIDAVGEGVTLATGSRVAVEPIHACGTCYHCRTGSHNRCERSRLFGVSARGGMAEFLAVPAQCLHVLPPDLDINVAALSEPMAVAVRGVRLGRVSPGDRVAVLGAGTIGLVSILAARAAGAEEVVATARYPQQRDLAASLGASRTFTDSASLLADAGGQVDVVIETVGGHADTIADAVAIARRGGTIVMLGVFDGAPAIPGLAFSTKELTLVGSNCYGRERTLGDFALATRLVDRHRALLAPLVTHRFTLDEIAQAYATAADKKSGAVKVQIGI